MENTQQKAFRRELLHLAIPLALQNLLTALVGASDALMLGRLNQDSIAAVSVANQVSFIMTLSTGSVVGAVGVLVAQYWGKKDYLNARRFLAMAVRYSVVLSLLFFGAAFFFPEQLLSVLTDEPELIRIGGEYLRIVSFSYLFMAVSQCYLMVMKVSEFARLSVIISAVTVAVDMAADFFLIYGMGPIPALGANGSAYSTVAVEVISLLWCLGWAVKEGHFRPKAEDFLFFSRDFERDVWGILPGMLGSAMSWGLSMTLHVFIMGHLGTDATAAASIAEVAKDLIHGLTHGLATGASIMIGQLLGQNELEKAKEYGRRCWRVTFWSGLINMGLLCLVGPLVLLFYVLEPQAKLYLAQMLLFNLVYMFAYAYNTIITCGVFPAGGDSKYDAISVFFATWCFSIPLALLGCFVFHWPVMAVYIVMCLDEIVKVPFIRRRYNKYLWLKNLTRETAEGGT